MSKEVLFFSDLDRTLIFSEKCLNSYDLSSKDLLPIEYIKDKIYSYIGPTEIELLSQLSNHANVKLIFVTARSYKEWLRLKNNFEYYSVYPDFVCCANGGHLYINNKENIQYRELILKDAQKIDDVLLLKINNFLSVEKAKIIDDTYVMAKIADNCEGMFTFESKIIHNQFYQIVGERKKRYIYPKNIDKGTSVKYLKEMYPNTATVAFGDNVADKPMLENCDLGFIPQSSIKIINDSKFNVVQNGPIGAEQICKKIINQLI